MYSIYDLCIFFLLVLLVMYWWRTREQHTSALNFARKYCKEREIQLLDETLVFQKIALSKNSSGQKVFSRIYSFDFCRDGQDRNKGEIVLCGYSVIRVMLETEQLEITQF